MVERTACEMHRITDSIRTHGTQPVSEDSTPSAGLCVRLLPLSIFYTLVVLYFSPSPSFSLTAFKGSFAPCSHTIDALSALIKPGGFFKQKLIHTGFMPNTCVTLPHVPFIHHYMHRYDLSFGQDGLPGSYAYPYVPDCSARW